MILSDYARSAPDLFELSLPLPVQSFGHPTDAPCQQWVTFIPARTTNDGTLAEVRKRIESYEGPAAGLWQIIRDGWKNPSAGSFSQLTAFSDWLRGQDGSARRPRTGLLLLSHHAGDQLWEQEGRNTLSPEALRGEFDTGSVAILDGCETGKPGSSAFVRRLNEHGFGTIIATATTIDGRLGADFLHCFATAVDQGARTPIKVLFGQTLECLKSETVDGQEWGPDRLTFMLLGDGEVPICR